MKIYIGNYVMLKEEYKKEAQQLGWAKPEEYGIVMSYDESTDEAYVFTSSSFNSSTVQVKGDKLRPVVLYFNNPIFYNNHIVPRVMSIFDIEGNLVCSLMPTPFPSKDDVYTVGLEASNVMSFPSWTPADVAEVACKMLKELRYHVVVSNISSMRQ